MSSEEERLKLWKFKRLIKTLENMEGVSNTSLITLIIPPNYQTSIVQSQLTKEYGTATNIKDRVNRLSVLDALTSTQQKLKQYPTLSPENGLAIFCGNVILEGGKEKKVCIDIVPHKPIHNKTYHCGKRFILESFDNLLHEDDEMGFIIIDGNGTLCATVQGNNKKILSRMTVDLPKKHKKGGQSAPRFQRLYQEARHTYLVKVSEMAKNCFLRNDICNVQGIIVAGNAEFKEKLSK